MEIQHILFKAKEVFYCMVDHVQVARETVAFLSLEILTTQLDTVAATCLIDPTLSRGFRPDDLQGSLQTQPLFDSMFPSVSSHLCNSIQLFTSHNLTPPSSVNTQGHSAV